MSAISSADIFGLLHADAAALAEREPLLARWLEMGILQAANWEEVIASRLAARLAHPALTETELKKLFLDILASEPDIGAAAAADIAAIRERDPACDSWLTPVLHFKGFHALTAHRFAHYLWKKNRREVALYLQSITSEVFAVDIHPAARLGRGLLLDHATSFVVGETAVIEDNVSILHEVTLGGTGKECGDRHPKVRSGVLIGAGAKLLGNIEIGVGAKIGAGSVVLDDVPPHTTVAGVPAVIVGRAREESPALGMDHHLNYQL